MLRIAAVALSVGLLPRPASACAVCFDPFDLNQKAFFDMTIFMSLMPLAFMGALTWWILRQYRLAAT